MNKLKNILTDLWINASQSVAFYPTVISMGLFLLSFGLLYVENENIFPFLYGYIPYFITDDADTGKTLMSTIIGGLFSLTVFSFSMVMLLLSQAASNYSPRLLPGLISDKNHQIILGSFLGTILYCLIISINITSKEAANGVPSLSIFIGLLLAILCLTLFVYFIHSISSKIQITYILQNIYKLTKERLTERIKALEDEEITMAPDSSGWFELASPHTGYLQTVHQQSLISISAKNELKIHVIVHLSDFILATNTVIRISQEPSDEIKQELLSCLTFNNKELVNQNYTLGIKQITEIIVKAMSPGINDPGTAISGINYLTDLFRLRMHLPDDEKITQGEEDGEVYQKIMHFEELVYNTLASIRQYAKHDILVVLCLLQMFRKLFQADNLKKEHKSTLVKQTNMLLEDAHDSISNKADLEKIVSYAQYLKEIEDTSFSIDEYNV